jgi:hypothetical protein
MNDLLHIRLAPLFLVILLICSPLIGYGKGRALGTITGSVKDSKGNPLAGVVVAILRDGANEIIKQTRTTNDGNFTTRILPGRYTLKAIADGFNEISFSSVEVSSSSQLVYKFNLEPIGSGKTVPELRKDRNDTKWRLRSAQNRRSVFQIQEEKDKTVETVASTTEEEPIEYSYSTVKESSRPTSRVHGVLEIYSATSASSSSAASYSGVNFALDNPITEDFNLIFAGQTGIGTGSPERLQTTARIRLNDRHRLNLTAAGMKINTILPTQTIRDEELGQISLSALDEWVVRNDVVVVFGLDYSRFVGASNNYSVSPRLGLQFDVNPRTRIKAAYTSGDTQAIQSSTNFEDAQIQFLDNRPKAIAYSNGYPVMERSRRMEVGIQRVLDDRSIIETSAFFDTTVGRGIGLLVAPLSAFSSENGQAILKIADQHGSARGLRLVYARRINSRISASAGYSFGQGQRLSSNGLTNPADIFDNGLFQTASAQIDANLSNKTHVRAVYRFSPRATVFAIDPFAGRLAVYDPSLSIMLTHKLPTFGLPVRVDAIVDARNILDFQTNADNNEKTVYLGSTRRSVRGGIAVRF